MKRPTLLLILLSAYTSVALAQEPLNMPSDALEQHAQHAVLLDLEHDATLSTPSASSDPSALSSVPIEQDWYEALSERIQSTDTSDLNDQQNVLSQHSEHSDAYALQSETHTDDNDPLEPFNRTMYRFNTSIDRAILEPVAKAYDAITPSIVQSGVNNFLSYLRTPIDALNFALQGEGQAFGHALGRFMINTLGFGVFDIASEAQIPQRKSSFGATFARWGMPSGPYLVLPFMAPGSLRTHLGSTVPGPDYGMSTDAQQTLRILGTLQGRVNVFSNQKALQSMSLDEYSMLRSIIQQREALQALPLDDQ